MFVNGNFLYLTNNSVGRFKKTTQRSIKEKNDNYSSLFWSKLQRPTAARNKLLKYVWIIRKIIFFSMFATNYSMLSIEISSFVVNDFVNEKHFVNDDLVSLKRVLF